MKKLLILVIGIISLNSCKKEDSQTQSDQNYQGRIYVKIETVDIDGVKSYSDIKTINVK